MPIYEYRCRNCDEKFEILIRSEQDEKNLSCSECGSKDVMRLYSMFGFSSERGFVSSTQSSLSCSSCGVKNCSSCK
ncbi:zinc ribbon domain-containing protein [candidate division KSB1 bacterium]|nr:MAG: zinc ribbon domain-containing protein [candidate division KSB1 bacterium]